MSHNKVTNTLKMRISLKEIWKNQEVNFGSGTTREPLELNSPVECFVGRIGVSNAKMFQIELDKEIPIHKNYLKKFHGVEIRLLESSLDRKAITIILSDNDLLDIYVLFLEDLIKVIETVDNINDIPLRINEKISYWGKLFARLSGELLSREKQRGLYGELTFLLNLLNSSDDFISTVLAWTGPEGTNQDFSNKSTAIEVKSSKATKPSVSIASELQLDWTNLENLFLNVLHVDEINNGSETLEKRIIEIKKKIAHHPDLVRLFEDKLDAVGIPYGHEKYYDKIGYIIRREKTYRVSDGFPSLTNQTINNNAIHNISYQIDLTACESFEIEIEKVIKEIL